jgi:hypothetical protein
LKVIGSNAIRIYWFPIATVTITTDMWLQPTQIYSLPFWRQKKNQWHWSRPELVPSGNSRRELVSLSSPTSGDLLHSLAG